MSPVMQKVLPPRVALGIVREEIMFLRAFPALQDQKRRLENLRRKLQARVRAEKGEK